MQDIKYTLRTLRKSPVFALSAILAAGLGIGATSAIFSIVDGVLLRPLPFPKSERLVNVWESNVKRNIPRMVTAPGNYYDWKSQNQVLSATGAYQGATLNLASPEGEPERFIGAFADPGFFTALQVAPFLGRTFTEEEDQPDHNDVVILSYNLWQQRFGADTGIVGRNLNLDGRPRTVVGVMPKGFEYPPTATIWTPFGLDRPNHDRRDFHRMRVIGRLRDGISIERARSDFQAIHARLAQQYPEFDADESTIVNPLLDDMVGDIRPALLVLLGAVGFVLLLACANVANLLLAKASGREREIAVRTSLGASRGAILRQMLTESLILAILGGAVGLLLGTAAFRWLISVAPANVPRINEVGLNWHVIELTALLSLATGLLFGFAPAWHASRIDVNSLLKEGMRGSSSRRRLPNALVIGQVAITLMLLAGAGLLIRSFYEIAHVDAGFNPERLMSMRLAPAGFKYRGHPELQIQLGRNILRDVAALPGVRSAAIATDIPLLAGPNYIMRFEGRPPVLVSQSPIANYVAVTPGFFDTMGMHIIRGRAINERDTADSPQVVVVNQTLVDRYFPGGQDPIGKRLEVTFAQVPQWREIVGVVADVRAAGLDKDTPVQVYAAYYQKPSLIGSFPPAAITVLARTAQDPSLLAGRIKSTILNIDRSQPVFAIQPMTDVVAASIAQRKLSFILLAFFAVSALVLASIGVYGVLSYSVTQRTGEIGIRMALGARQGQVLFQVERQGMMLVLAGLGLGILGAFAFTRFMTQLLFRVSAHDPATFAIAAGTLLIVSLAACYLPARRAAQVDPMIALRSE